MDTFFRIGASGTALRGAFRGPVGVTPAPTCVHFAIEPIRRLFGVE